MEDFIKIPIHKKINIYGILQELSTGKLILIIFIIGFIVYINSLFNGFVGDDTILVVYNTSIHSVTNIGQLFFKGSIDEPFKGAINNYYKPLQTIALSLIYSVSFGKPFAFHLIQLLIHTSNTILIFLIFKKFFKKEISFLLSLLFLVHPINTEAVIYISALQDTQFLFFGLLALYLTTKDYDGILVPYLIGLLELCALLSKETGAVFLFIIPLYNYLFQKRKLLTQIVQSTSALLIYAILRFYIVGIYFNTSKVVPIMTLSLAQRLMVAPKIIFFYIKTFFYPMDLLIYQSWTVKSFNLGDFYLPLISDLALLTISTAICIMLLKTNKALFKTYLFFFIWLLIGLALHLQVVPLDQTVSDRWFYLPVIGFLGLIGTATKFSNLERLLRKTIILICIALVFLLLSIRVIIRNNNWNNEFRLCSHDIQHNENSAQLHDCLGVMFSSRGNMDLAQEQFIDATKLYPNEINLTQLGIFYLNYHKPDKAESAFQESLRYGDYYATYEKYAALILANKDPKSAEIFINKALSKYPSLSRLWEYLALAKYKLGDKDNSINAAKKAYSLYPNPETQSLLQSLENNEAVNIPKY